MIQATYRALTPQQNADRLQLKLQELTVFQGNFSTVNTTAALVGGFAFSGVTSGITGAVEVKVIFFVITVMCIASCFHSVIVSTAASVMGPDTAMRGGDPEANVAGVVLSQHCGAQSEDPALELAIGSGLCIAIFLGSLLMVVHTHRKMRRLFSKQDVYARQTGLAPTLH
eukprot:TRINITY_DN4342_c0_g1_i1.p1 TRINITY_DN4342_c0_g1~~TRINITY_DN4342_c0_g1_i1.p1  ORF type:complete len:170 (+),score=41.94 TRINITY_DN4342_c0_g1_i1:71-580(+)